MSDILLATKIHIPSLHLNRVSRQYLIQRLNDGISQNSRLTLVSAPAGYGKSTLLSEWVSSLDIPVAWLTLEKRENTPARFWNYFFFALSTIPHVRQTKEAETIFQGLRSPHPLPLDVLLTHLVNLISTLEKGAVLVLDDLHAITEDQIHQHLVFLIDHLPISANSLHLVFASRMDPPWPLARWRARCQLVEIRTSDLRFKTEETAVFLNQVMRLGISLEDVHALQNRTEGWIAGLQMAALSLQGRADASEFIRDFIGSNRYIFDYLVDEILSRQEPDMQEFLLKTSILERLSASLCDAILGQSNSQSFLDRLEKNNLFLVPLDDARSWYRYHLLFADLLASSLKKSLPEIVLELHKRACAWFEANDLLSEALAHALAAGDLDRLSKIVERYAFAIMEAHEASSLLNWLNSLPDRVTESHPWLSIARAWLLAYLGKNDLIEQALSEAEKSADPADRRLMGYIAAMRTLSGEFGNRPIRNGIAQAQQALEMLPEDEFRPRAFVCYHVANILEWHGDTSAALKALVEAAELSRSAGDFEMAMTAQFEIANILRYKGELKESLRMFERTHQMAAPHLTERKSLSTGFAYLQQAQIYLEWNDLEKALQFAREGIRLCKIWGYSDFLYNGWFYYAGILYETGDLDGALSAIQEAKQILSENSPGNRVLSLEAVINQARRDWTGVAAWLASCGMSPADSPDFENRFEYLLFASVLEGQGKLDEAYRILEGLRVVVERVGANNLLLKILTREAVIADTLGEKEKAFNLLRQALDLAEPEGFVRVFVKKGKGMEQLLRKALTAGIQPDFARMLLEKCQERSAATPIKKLHLDFDGGSTERTAADRTPERARAGSTAPAQHQP